MFDCYKCNVQVENQLCETTVRVGNVTVKNHGVPVFVCPSCGESFLDGTVLEACQLQSAAAVLRRGLAAGEGLRFARHVLGITQVELGRILQRGPEWISRCESSTENASRPDQLAMVTLLEDALRAKLRGEEWTYPSLDDKSASEIDLPTFGWLTSREPMGVSAT